MRYLLVLLAAAALGCSSAASDFEKICNAEALSGAAQMVDPSQKAMTIAGWIQKSIASPEALELMETLASVEPQTRADMLRQAAADAGYRGPCPLADAK